MFLGEVSLHRLTWARAVNLGPYKEGITVKALAWKPDGKVIAIGYSSSKFKSYRGLSYIEYVLLFV